MYESPIHLYMTDMQTQIIRQQEDQILKAVQSVAVGVDREELFRALKYDRDQYDKGFRDGTPKWIPVEEDQPVDGAVVLVYGKRGGIYTAEFMRNGGHYWFHKLNSKNHHCEPTHWMPLPEPPEGR